MTTTIRIAGGVVGAALIAAVTLLWLSFFPGVSGYVAVEYAGFWAYLAIVYGGAILLIAIRWRYENNLRVVPYFFLGAAWWLLYGFYPNLEGRLVGAFLVRFDYAASPLLIYGTVLLGFAVLPMIRASLRTKVAPYQPKDAAVPLQVLTSPEVFTTGALGVVCSFLAVYAATNLQPKPRSPTTPLLVLLLLALASGLVFVTGMALVHACFSKRKPSFRLLS